MNPVTFVFGMLLAAAGFVALVRRVHDRSVHETLAVLRNSRGDTGPAVTAFVSLLVPIVSSIASGIAILAVSLMGRSVAPFSWLGW